MSQNNESCSLSSQCEDVKRSLNNKLISIADAQLYNTRYELGREVDYNLYILLRHYKKYVSDICSNANCGYCYGGVPESILERSKILTTL